MQILFNSYMSNDNRARSQKLQEHTLRNVPRGGVGGFIKSVSCEVNPESCEDTLERRATPAGRCYTVMTQGGERKVGKKERTENGRDVLRVKLR